ncbi:MAG: helix-turn-helix domain-containing protein [Blastocatellia bacterium]
MGVRPKKRQRKLPAKLLRIRTALKLSQNQLLRRLDLEPELDQSSISTYESGKREPPLYVILRYAETAGVCADVLINDDLSLPRKIPANPKYKPC